MNTCRREGCDQPVAPWSGRGRPPGYCDEHYGGEGRLLPAERECEGCGEPIPEDRRADALFCSDECKAETRDTERWGRGSRTRQMLAALDKAVQLDTLADRFEANPSIPVADGHIERLRRMSAELFASVPPQRLLARADEIDKRADWQSRMVSRGVDPVLAERTRAQAVRLRERAGMVPA